MFKTKPALSLHWLQCSQKIDCGNQGPAIQNGYFNLQQSSLVKFVLGDHRVHLRLPSNRDITTAKLTVTPDCCRAAASLTDDRDRDCLRQQQNTPQRRLLV